MTETPVDYLVTEVLPLEIQRRLRELLDARKMGSFTIHTNEKGDMVKIEEKTWSILDRPHK